MIKIYHTKGDSDPMRIRLIRNGNPQDLTGYTAQLTAVPIGEEVVPVINGAMTPDPDQVANRGWVEYVFTANDDLLAAGIYEANVFIDNGTTDQKTFPTDTYGQDYFLIYLLDAAQ